jgi:hypothetical protein
VTGNTPALLYTWSQALADGAGHAPAPCSQTAAVRRGTGPRSLSRSPARYPRSSAPGSRRCQMARPARRASRGAAFQNSLAAPARATVVLDLAYAQHTAPLGFEDRALGVSSRASPCVSDRTQRVIHGPSA